MAQGYSYERTQRELSNEYQHDRFKTFFKNICILVLLMKESLALEGLKNANGGKLIPGTMVEFCGPMEGVY